MLLSSILIRPFRSDPILQGHIGDPSGPALAVWPFQSVRTLFLPACRGRAFSPVCPTASGRTFAAYRILWPFRHKVPHCQPACVLCVCTCTFVWRSCLGSVSCRPKTLRIARCFICTAGTFVSTKTFPNRTVAAAVSLKQPPCLTCLHLNPNPLSKDLRLVCS